MGVIVINTKSIVKALVTSLFLGWAEQVSLARADALSPVDIDLHFEKRFDLPTPGAAVAVTWSPDGSYLAAASNFGQMITVWDSGGSRIGQFRVSGGGPALGASLAFVDGETNVVFPPPDRVSKDAALAVWDIRSGNVVGEVPGPAPGQGYQENRAIYFQVSPNQQILAAGTYARGNNFVVYDLMERKVLQTSHVQGGIFSLCLFAQGHLAAVGSSNGRIEIIDVFDNTRIDHLRVYGDSDYGTISIGAVAGSPDGALLFAGAGLILFKGQFARTAEAESWRTDIKPAWVLRLSDRSKVSAFPEIVASPIRKAIWDPDGRYVAFVDNAGSVHVWQPLSTNNTYQNIKLSSAGFSIAISPDGKSIAATTNSGVSVISLSTSAP